MRLLLVTATAAEIAPLVAAFTPEVIADAVAHTLPDVVAEAAADAATRVALSRAIAGDRLASYEYAEHAVDVLTTGVGMVATAVWCSRVLASTRYDLALNLGVCGSFHGDLPAGTLVHVVSDRIAELGAEDGDRFLPLDELGLLRPDEFPFRGGELVNDVPPASAVIAAAPRVRGITVNTVHGEERSIARAVERWHPDTESMEGAAFMYSCLAAGTPFAQLRSVSNQVERRNRAAWDLPGAVARLCASALQLIDDL